MAGKLIVTAPAEHMGVTKMIVYFNGVDQGVKVAQGDTCELDVTADVDLHVTITATGLKTKPIRISANNVTEIAYSKKAGTWKYTLEMVQFKETPVSEYDQVAEKPVYDLVGARGRRMKVFEDKCIIRTMAGVGSFITGNGSDGEKTIYYTDVLGVQYKRCGVQLGYLQLETASATMNNKTDNFFNENSFTFDNDLGAKMEEVQKYIKQKVDEAKKNKNAPVVVAGAVSSADELKKFKEILDMGIITQEEFDAKKKQLLGL